MESATVRLEITRRAELAVRAMTLLAVRGERMKAPALAEALDTTAAFVPQVMGALVKAGWVRSEPGPSGGYASLVGPGAVSVLDVVEAVDGVTDLGRCVMADRPCRSATPCLLHVAWGRARAELVRVLGDTPLSAVAVGGAP
jgi:Rrf2 family protein